MTKKYIVKNCELICNGECPNSKTGFCEDCTDCLIKQIIERCKVSTNYHSEDMYVLGRTNMAGIVLALLHIEEVG